MTFCKNIYNKIIYEKFYCFNSLVKTLRKGIVPSSEGREVGYGSVRIAFAMFSMTFSVLISVLE
jgi:hypothetical protein